jgi:hypothetical protein
LTLHQLRALDEMLRPACEDSPSAEMVGRYRELLVRTRNALLMSWPLDRNLVAGLRSAAKDLARAHRRVSRMTDRRQSAT